ncbi:DUF4410 domain-containing protein [Marilutibacter spongiae]|uniref:DUF4410 domain-containing protein n=1 Tax=Marilutibacter spongiae TaxID=2025720 RepID=A0A7W3TL85_9GAMM|nr:DUF4410 domain-containing protein [Lysobacter spongiae]MBB1060438.1 DUF4410 domain-containing protein [Lysobacter spongiae]
MLRNAILLGVLALLSACATNSVTHQAITAPADLPFRYTILNTEEASVEGLAMLRESLDEHLQAAGRLAATPEGPAIPVEITITNYYMRHGGARFMVGIMAGRDSLRSRVRVFDGEGKQIGAFEVESTNATAWGTTGGMIDKHAEEIVAKLTQ